MAKYVAVGVLAVIVLAALTYESPEQQQTAQVAAEEDLEGAYGGESPTEATPAGPLSERVAEVVAEVAQAAEGRGDDAAEEETPAEPAPTPASTAGTTTRAEESSAGKFVKHTVQKGETLSDVARAMLGTGKRWREVYDYNRERIGESPNHVRAGLTLVFPAEKASVPASATPTVATVTASHSSGRSYTVQKGDTLYGIARSQLGSGTRWKEIASLNGLDGAELVAGKTLALPTR